MNSGFDASGHGGPVNGVWQFTPQHYSKPAVRSTGPCTKPGARRSRLLPWNPRYQIITLCFLATLTAYVERTGFSIAYTGMAKTAGLSESVKGTVLSAFYWGYALSQIPGGMAAQRYGGDVMLSLSFALWATASLLTPGTADSVRAIILARVCVGVAQGFLIPAVHTVLSAWVPPTERARAVSLTTSGMYLGSALAMQALPAVAAAFGPASLLRLSGALGLAWLLTWRASLATLGRRPPSIPVSSSGPADDGKGFAPGSRGRPGATPWRAMLRSPAVWAIVANNFTFHYAFYVLMNWIPTYFDKVLGADLSTMGAAKTLPYLTMFAASNAGGWAGDWLINTRRAGVAAGRKAVNSAGFWAAAAALLLMPGARSVAGGVAVTTLALGTCGFARGGFSVNHMDIAPKFAGIVMGISNTAGTLAGVIGVAATGVLLEGAGGAGVLAGWYAALAVAASLCLAGSLIFLWHARGERLFGGDATRL
ncbi:PHT4B [Auxenochlorella protothecoides x Auxenochlorella symbiontica]